MTLKAGEGTTGESSKPPFPKYPCGFQRQVEGEAFTSLSCMISDTNEGFETFDHGEDRKQGTSSMG